MLLSQPTSGNRMAMAGMTTQQSAYGGVRVIFQ